jgi:hypothetical protein
MLLCDEEPQDILDAPVLGRQIKRRPFSPEPGPGLDITLSPRSKFAEMTLEYLESGHRHLARLPKR